MKNDRGWVAFDDTGIIFAERNREIFKTILPENMPEQQNDQ
jgi:UPF0288 family protein (methanogenesis marker protein 3)